MRCANALKAKVANGPCSSRRHGSLSAAADLVVKPVTPPKKISQEAANASLTPCLVAHSLKLGVMPSIGAPVVKPSPQSKRDSMRVHVGESKQEEAVAEVVTEKPGSKALIEVRGMSGESIIKEDFPLSERVLSVKMRVFKTRGHPLWQQVLSCQGCMVNDQSTLGELSLPQDTVFDLVLKSGPSREDMQALADAATEALTAGMKGMNTLTKQMVLEIRAFAKPPPGCEKVCVAALHVLAGLAPEIGIKRDGSPKVSDWSQCRVMMGDAGEFIKRALELPSCIDQGRVKKERVDKCRQLIYSIDGDSEADKIHNMRRCSMMCEQLLTFLFGVVKYYDGVAEFRERFGGATITELQSHQ